MTCELRTNSVVTTEMPTLLPMLRIRLNTAVPSLRSAGDSVAKVMAASGT